MANIFDFMEGPYIVSPRAFYLERLTPYGIVTLRNPKSFYAGGEAVTHGHQISFHTRQAIDIINGAFEMNDLDFPRTPEADEYLRDIADEMVTRFRIDLDEAIGRINEHFAGRTLIHDDAVSMLTHEETDVWANHIYYGRTSGWWMEASSPSPRPYPGFDNQGEGF